MAKAKTPPGGPIRWTFETFLIDRDGTVVARFDPRVPPHDDAIVTAIKRELFAGE